jgi:hypothetical protein
MDALTARMSRAYNRLRRVRNMANSLRLDKATATGYTQISGSPITTGFYYEYMQDAETGEQFLQVLVAETGWSASMMASVAAVVMDSKRHKVNVILPPKGAPLVWQLKASPTGEAVS